MTFQLTANDIGQELRTAFYAARVASSPSLYGSIQHAATAAMTQAAALLKSGGRANIGAAGFSSKWQNAWRVNVYPKSGESIDAAVFGYHKIPYSLIFEKGGHISGNLWIPLSTVPKDGRRSHFTAARLAQTGVKLFSINRPGTKPLLAANIRTGGQKASTLLSTVRGRRSASGRLISVAQLRKGTKGKRGSITTVPLFIGLSSVDIRKRFNIAGVGDAVAAKVPDLYAANLEG